MRALGNHILGDLQKHTMNGSCFKGFPGWRNVLMILVRVYYVMIWISLCMSLCVGSFWYLVMFVARLWLQLKSTKVIIKYGHVEY